MGSSASKARSLPKSVPSSPTAMNRTQNVDQIQRLKQRLNKQEVLEASSPVQQPAPSQRDSNRTVSDFITKKLGNINIEKEMLKLNPNHSSLKRLSNKKQLEEDYKKIIESLGNGKKTDILETSYFKEILLSLPSVPKLELIKRYNISSEMYDKINNIANVISIPTVKVQIPQQNLRRQRLSDDNDNTGSRVENELNLAFTNILEGSQTGYDISGGEDGKVHNQRPAHRRLQNEVKRTF